jgi:hypothetical protein
MKAKILASVIATAAVLCGAKQSETTPAISGDYLEVRTCDVYTGPCFANAEMNLTGKEAILVWSVRQGVWNSTAVDGLKVIAVVRTDATLDDQRYHPGSGEAVLIVDANANGQQREALTDLAKSMAGRLIKNVRAVKTSNIDASIATCSKSGCASVKAGDLVEVSTRCFSDQDHVCGNEDTYYPPLTSVNGAIPAFTELAAFKGSGLNVNWQSAGQRSAFLAAFSR